MSVVNKIEPRLVEVTSLPVHYADGVGKVTIEGTNARITYFEYRTFGTERVKMPVVEMVRPLASCSPDTLQGLIKQATGQHGDERTH